MLNFNIFCIKYKPCLYMYRSFNIVRINIFTFAAVTPILGERTQKLEFTIKKLMDVAKELKESKKTTDAANTSRLKKLGKR